VKRADIENKSGDIPLHCNSCGKILKIENGILKEDAFEATKEWGYFSDRDMEVHHFNLCEDCYEELISKFLIPVEVRKKIEAL
jgi:Fe2+ or Zn2+ uptake regulation protein